MCQFRDKHTVGGIVFYKHAFLAFSCFVFSFRIFIVVVHVMLFSLFPSYCLVHYFYILESAGNISSSVRAIH